jgi:hypothetical protein
MVLEDGALSLIGKILGFVTGSTAATNKAVKASNYAADQNNALLRDIWHGNQSNIEPFVQSGGAAREQYNSLIGLPSSVSPEQGQQGFQNYLNNFGFQHELDQGSTAIRGNQASRRLLGSGSTLKRLQDYGLGLRSQYQGNYLNYLGNQQAAGLSAAGTLAGTSTAYTGQVVQNNDSRATNIGNAALAGAANNTNYLTAAMTAAAMMSDERAKIVTAKLGELEDGLPIFRFRYIGSDLEHAGPMAQDVALYRPWALGPVRDDGMMTILPAMLEAA